MKKYGELNIIRLFFLQSTSSTRVSLSDEFIFAINGNRNRINVRVLSYHMLNVVTKIIYSQPQVTKIKSTKVLPLCRVRFPKCLFRLAARRGEESRQNVWSHGF